MHGDISLGNIVIIRFLPNIILAATESDPIIVIIGDTNDIFSTEVPSTTCVSSAVISSSSEKSSASLTLPAVDPLAPSLLSTATDKSTPGDSLPKAPTLDARFLQNLGSGGSVIDFDYSRSRGRFSNKASVSTSDFLFYRLLIVSTGDRAVHVN